MMDWNAIGRLEYACQEINIRQRLNSPQDFPSRQEEPAVMSIQLTALRLQDESNRAI